MRQRVIFVLIDGLSLEAARRRMSFMAAMTEAGRLRAGVLEAMLPPLSRPAYASMLSGMAPLDHGVLGNDSRHPPLKDTFFHKARRAGARTAAAAYSWLYELCLGRDFNLMENRLLADDGAPIQRGLFYASDAYPDAEAFADGEALRRNWDPDLLLIHCMGADFAGHQHGGASREYRDAARVIDALLARLMPLWLSEGCEVICAADHGMNEEGRHYDADPASRAAPLWVSAGWPEPPSSPAGIGASILAAMGLK